MNKCELCGAEFPNRVWIDGKKRNVNKRKYCLTCSPFGKHNTAVLPRSKPHRCEICGKPLKKNASFCCSRACIVEKRFREWIKRWKAGEETGLRGGVGVSARIRKYLKLNQGDACAICGWAEVNPATGLVPLHLDHKDGNWRNNNPDNLWLICPNHHALTSTYGSLNRGHGRPYHIVKSISG